MMNKGLFLIIRFSFSTVSQIPGFFLSDHVSDDWRWAWDWRTLSWSSSVFPRQCPQAERTLELQSSWPWSPRTQHCWSVTRGQYQLQCSPCSSQQCQAGGCQSTEIWNIYMNMNMNLEDILSTISTCIIIDCSCIYLEYGDTVSDGLVLEVLDDDPLASDPVDNLLLVDWFLILTQSW